MSLAGSVVGIMLKFSTSTFTTFGEEMLEELVQALLS
jgi:hypothetical protein